MRWLMVALLLVSACGGADSAVTEAQPAVTLGSTTTTLPPPTTSVTAATEPTGAGVQPCADVIDATAEQAEDGTWMVSATVRSGDTGWDKYADLWEIYVNGEKVGERVLAHPHETEQPFTRSTNGVVIPDGTDRITVAARDSVNGFCGEVYELELG